MNIGIDIDDTITDTSEFLMPYVAKYLNLNMEKLKQKNITYDSFPIEYKGREKEFGREIFEKVLTHVTLKKDAKEVISKLKSQGNKIIIITARDKSLYDEPFEFTSNQLSNLGIEYDKLFCTFNKRQVCIDEKIDLFIDDNVNNLNSVEGIVSNIVLFNSKMNLKQDSNFKRVNCWKEIEEYIDNEIM